MYHRHSTRRQTVATAGWSDAMYCEYPLSTAAMFFLPKFQHHHDAIRHGMPKMARMNVTVKNAPHTIPMIPSSFRWL